MRAGQILGGDKEQQLALAIGSVFCSINGPGHVRRMPLQMLEFLALRLTVFIARLFEQVIKIPA